MIAVVPFIVVVVVVVVVEVVVAALRAEITLNPVLINVAVLFLVEKTYLKTCSLLQIS